MRGGDRPHRTSVSREEASGERKSSGRKTCEGWMRHIQMGKGFEKQAPREATDSSIKSESMVAVTGAGAGDGIFVERSAKDVGDISKIRPLPPPSSLNPNLLNMLRRCARREMIQEQPQLGAQYLWVSFQTDRTW